MKTTNDHIKYWSERKIDWVQSYFNPDHPHRQLIVDEFTKLKQAASVLELGCASGANIYRLMKAHPRIGGGGTDISKDAIDTARMLRDEKRIFPQNTMFEVGGAEKIFLSDHSVDVVLTDMCLIYLGPSRIKTALKEIARVGRDSVIFCEFHSTNPFKRLGLKLASGYNAYNYPKLLEKAGYYNVEVRKLTEKDWPGGEPQKTFGYIITARLPKKRM